MSRSPADVIRVTVRCPVCGHGCPLPIRSPFTVRGCRGCGASYSLARIWGSARARKLGRQARGLPDHQAAILAGQLSEDPNPGGS